MPTEQTPYYVRFRRDRRTVGELLVDAPDGKAVRPALRAYMTANSIDAARATWKPVASQVAEAAAARGVKRIDWQWHPLITATLITATQDGHQVQVAWPRSARRVTDYQRRRVYDADRELFPSWLSARSGPGTFDTQRRFSSVSHMQAYVDSMGLAQKVTVVQPSARARRGRAKYSGNTVSMPPWTWFEEYLLHEVAHHVTAWELGDGYRRRTFYAPHGPEFVRTLHSLIAKHMGIDAGNAYERACHKHGVRGIDYSITATMAAAKAHEVPLAAGSAPKRLTDAERGYVDSYRRYRQGARNSAPSLRKNMTKERGAELRAAIDNEVL